VELLVSFLICVRRLPWVRLLGLGIGSAIPLYLFSNVSAVSCDWESD
jgi:hypothetical protein